MLGLEYLTMEDRTISKIIKVAVGWIKFFKGYWVEGLGSLLSIN